MKNEGSMGPFNFRDRIVANVERNAGQGHGIHLDARWKWKCYRRGILLWEENYKNRVVDEGLIYALTVMFLNGTPIPSWYIALFEDNHTPLAGDVYAAPGYVESVAYDEATRPLWNCGSVVANSIGNSLSFASFTLNATKNIYGGALVSDSVKGVPSAATTWRKGHVYTKDQVVVPVAPTGRYYACSVAGTTGGSEPTWPATSPAGLTVVDNGVTWKDIGTVTDQVLFSSGKFDVAKPVEDNDIVKVSIEITANAVVA